MCRCSMSERLAIVPLSGGNYTTWKVQCKMALVKESLGKFVEGTQSVVREGEKGYAKYIEKRDRALALVVLSIDLRLLYLIGEPDNPATVWTMLKEQFMKMTWANKLELRRKLHSLRLKEGSSVKNHIRELTELFHALAEQDAPLSEEDRVIYLLASLPESFNEIVTAFKANDKIPKMVIVTERLLYEERKVSIHGEVNQSGEKVMTTKTKKFQKKGPCHHCGRMGHCKRDCWELKSKDVKHKTHKVTQIGSDEEALVVDHVLCVGLSASWIVDSGATCQICIEKEQFVHYSKLCKPEIVSLGDGIKLKAVGRGTILFSMKLPGDKCRRCRFEDVLHVPDLSYNLVSVSKITKVGKTIKFNESGCEIENSDGCVVATAIRCGNLYFLNCEISKRANIVEYKEVVRHKRYGHLGVQSLKKLAVDHLVNGFSYNYVKQISFCDTCTEGKHQRNPLPTGEASRAKEPLSLVHTDVCGKLPRSLGGAEYFVTFIDDCTRFVWVYFLKNKSDVFDKFLNWKAMVEKLIGLKLKVLCSDNGGEYTSTQFSDYLKAEGVVHEYTVPKTLEQNGVAERRNRTLIEMTRSMLAGSNYLNACGRRLYLLQST